MLAGSRVRPLPNGPTCCYHWLFSLPIISFRHRYHPHLLLAKSRFLFPLTSKRLGIIKELLRASETNSLHPCQVARIDRRVPLKERHKYPASNTVFMQAFNCLKNKDLNFRYFISADLHCVRALPSRHSSNLSASYPIYQNPYTNSNTNKNSAGYLSWWLLWQSN